MNAPILAVSIDTETTGNDPKTDGICQLAAVALAVDGNDYDIQTILSTYCKPSIPIKKDAYEVHGISPDMLVWSPDEYTAIQTLVAEIEYLENEGFKVVVGGHNSERFDFPIINRIFEEESPFPDMQRFDTMMLARRLWPDREHKLGLLYEWYLGKDAINAHDAAADCWMVSQILQEMCEEYGKDPLVYCTECATPVVYEYMPFGKHKGLDMTEVPTSYLHWMKNKFKEPDKDLLTTIEWYLKEHETA